MLTFADYYPFGEKLPTRDNITGQYRYAYQGQELDPETGMEAFQLRLWDGRIGRWLNPDPYGQYFSPYLGMGNNPVNGIDPDGGCYVKNKDGSYSPCKEGEIGDKTIDSFGYAWIYSSKGWQLKNDAKGKVPATYIPVTADGTENYYVKRYVEHIKTFYSKPPDYYLSYGHKYLNTFSKVTNEKLSREGKIWLRRTRLELQRLMEKGLKETNGAIAMNNEKFQKFAYSTHIPAYVGSGLLNLSVKDKFIIGDAPEPKDLANLDGIGQVLGVIKLELQDPTFLNRMLMEIGRVFVDKKSNCGCE